MLPLGSLGEVPRGRPGAHLKISSQRALPAGFLVVGMCAGFSGVAMAITLLDRLSPFEVVFVRLAIGGVVLVAFFRPRVGTYDAGQLRAIAALGISLAVLTELTMIALKYLPLGAAATYMFVGPLGLSLLGSRHAIDLLWVAVAAAGIALLTGARLGGDALGIALALLAAAAWASYIVCTSRLAPRFSKGDGQAVAIAMAALLAIPLVFLDPHWSELAQPSNLVKLFVSGLLLTVVMFRLELAALRRLPARVFGVLMSLEPGLAVITGFVLLGEPLLPQEVAGIAFVVAASAGASLTDEPSPPTVRDLETTQAPPLTLGETPIAERLGLRDRDRVTQEDRAEETPQSIRSYVGGQWLEGTGAEIADVNPARPDEVLALFRQLDRGQVASAVEAAGKALGAWRRTSVHQRGEILVKAASALESKTDEFASTIAREQGRPLKDAVAEVYRAVSILRYFASEAEREEGEVFAGRRAQERVLTTRAPVGPVALITPWNVPLAIPIWKLAPALMAGNTAVWKPASIVPLISVLVVEALETAGLPAGVCNLVFTDNESASGLLREPQIKACSFTGSTEVGQRVQALGAQAGVRVQAEMGGKNAAIVLDDADLDFAAQQVISGAMGWAGQRCTATSRALVGREVYDDFVDRVGALASKLTVGDPLDPETEVGPLASEAQHRRVRDYFEIARREGAEIVVGGGAADPANGYFAEPTIATGVEPDHRVYLEEVFGPMVAMVPVSDCEQAFELGNLGRYGLSGAIFTNDLTRVLEAIEHFDVGVLHINSETVGSDPHVPFGGLKDSGTAQREMGRAAREFYTDLKTVYLRPPSA